MKNKHRESILKGMEIWNTLDVQLVFSDIWSIKVEAEIKVK